MEVPFASHLLLKGANGDVFSAGARKLRVKAFTRERERGVEAHSCDWMDGGVIERQGELPVSES